MNGLHDSVPQVAEFPAELVHVEGKAGDRRTWVEGLREAMQGCYQQGVLPGEAGVRWSQAGTTVDLRGYGDFPGGSP
jgi:hypothetical protein